ncbi:endo alpha-1,4 polygalactosaminidase [Bacillus sp. 2205SS5-2]|uniref:endo alpha-1,4 polygalactosaminidase n=1 Tax=Bacillus sp. 2205SS5-2 TaxID=3109031 RepID=UPI003004770A
MKNFDLVIVDPYHYSKEQVEHIQSAGTKVIGYISTTEVGGWNSSLLAQFEEDDFIWRNGEKVTYSWDAYLMDLTSRHYQEIMKQEVDTQIHQKGFDGILLDSIGNLEQEFTDEARTNQEDALVSFINNIKKDKVLIQNGAFDVLSTKTVPYIDGVLWAFFEKNKIQRSSWSQTTVNQLIELRSIHQISVFTISLKEEATQQYSDDLGFTHYHDHNRFMKW